MSILFLAPACRLYLPAFVDIPQSGSPEWAAASSATAQNTQNIAYQYIPIVYQ
jgi:hypothetical protein